MFRVLHQVILSILSSVMIEIPGRKRLKSNVASCHGKFRIEIVRNIIFTYVRIERRKFENQPSYEIA